MTRMPRHVANIFVLAAVLVTTAALADAMSPHDWLARMSGAVQTTNYEGTVVRVRGGSAEAMKVVHVVSDGVIREKVVAQEGNGLEIIRNGNEVHCILPESKSVLVEEWDDQSTLFSTLPSSDIHFGADYDVSIVRKERVAGRQAMLLAVRPHDEYRYGHRIWLDIETGFPLQTKLVDNNGATIEQVKFADISLDAEIHSSAFAPSYSLDSFTWITEPRESHRQVVESDWRAADLPSGFAAESVNEEQLPGTEQPVTHILYSDGIARVSVFIASKTSADIGGKSRLGTSNSYSVANGDYVITAVGEVPASTVEKIAKSVQRN